MYEEKEESAWPSTLAFSLQEGIFEEGLPLLQRELDDRRIVVSRRPQRMRGSRYESRCIAMYIAEVQEQKITNKK